MINGWTKKSDAPKEATETSPPCFDSHTNNQQGNPEKSKATWKQKFSPPTEAIEDTPSHGKFVVELKREDFADIKNSPFAGDNTYNYHINISHPAIAPVFQEYKKFVGEGMILSDPERYDFEHYILDEFSRLDINKRDYPEKKPPQKQRDFRYR